MNDTHTVGIHGLRTIIMKQHYKVQTFILKKYFSRQRFIVKNNQMYNNY